MFFLNPAVQTKKLNVNPFLKGKLDTKDKQDLKILKVLLHELSKQRIQEALTNEKCIFKSSGAPQWVGLAILQDLS